MIYNHTWAPEIRNERNDVKLSVLKEYINKLKIESCDGKARCSLWEESDHFLVEVNITVLDGLLKRTSIESKKFINRESEKRKVGEIKKNRDLESRRGMDVV